MNAFVLGMVTQHALPAMVNGFKCVTLIAAGSSNGDSAVAGDDQRTGLSGPAVTLGAVAGHGCMSPGPTTVASNTSDVSHARGGLLRSLSEARREVGCRYGERGNREIAPLCSDSRQPR